MALDTATLDALLETTEDPIVVLDTADGVVDCNEAARGLASIDDEWAGLSVRDFLSAVPSLADDIVSGSLDGATYTLTVDGTERVFDPTISHIEDGEDGVQGRLVRLDEITESRDRAQELERSRERYHTLFESDQLVLWEQDFSEAMAYAKDLAADVDDFGAYLEDHPEELGRIFERVEVLAANRRALEFFGAESEAELEANLDRLLTEKSIGGMTEMWTALLNGETTFRRECEARQLDTGERRHEILEINVPESQRDDYSQVYTASIDITERKRREQELERAKERYHRILDRSSDYVLICSEDGSIDYISPGVEATLGYSLDELTGDNAFKLIHPSDKERAESVFSEMVANPSIDREIEYRTRASDGEYRWTEARGSNYPDDPLINGVMVTIRDVTERKHREEELERTNEFLDEFARVVSHDVATPLGVIENKARLIEITQDTSHAADIYEATERVQSLIDDLEALAREGNQVGDIGSVELAGVSRDAWETVESPHGELVVESSTAIDADRGRLQQLLENLLVNAVEHSGHDDTSVAISDGSGQRRRSTAASEPARASTPGVTIRVGTFSEGFYVADDGPGIPADDRETVFEQGYTTADEGTGLGLAIVDRIADGHGWEVTVTDSETGGARFEVWTNGRPEASKSEADTDVSGS